MVDENALRDSEDSRLLNSWVLFWKEIGAEGNPDAYFNFLKTHYREPHRRYHTFGHIEHCLREFGDARPWCENSKHVEMAIWFHDVIYNVDHTAHLNEARSARVAYGMLLTMGMTEEFSSRVKDLIVYTQHNIYPSANDVDATVLLDVDLSSLGAPRTIFDQDGIDIRHEYQNVPNDQFNAAREKLFEGFLNRPSIYYTTFFRQKYEKQARQNLTGAIYSLRRWGRSGWP